MPRRCNAEETVKQTTKRTKREITPIEEVREKRIELKKKPAASTIQSRRLSGRVRMPSAKLIENIQLGLEEKALASHRQKLMLSPDEENIDHHLEQSSSPLEESDDLFPSPQLQPHSNAQQIPAYHPTNQLTTQPNINELPIGEHTLDNLDGICLLDLLQPTKPKEPESTKVLDSNPKLVENEHISTESTLYINSPTSNKEIFNSHMYGTAHRTLDFEWDDEPRQDYLLSGAPVLSAFRR